MAGWIKLHRKFLEWEWYNDIPCKVLALHLILSANFEENKYKGFVLKKGQLLVTWETLSSETGLTFKQVRRAVKKLEIGQFLGRERAGKNTLITICNYESYQQKENPLGQGKGRKRAGKGQEKGSPINKEEEEEYINPSIISLNFDAFWDLYDKKVGRPKCEKKWNSLSISEREEAMSYIAAYKLAQPDKQFRKNPETFLNQKSWNDEIISNNGAERKKDLGPSANRKSDCETPKDYTSDLRF